MKKKKKIQRRIIGTAVILFIAANILLVFFDHQDKVAEKSYVKEWSRSFTADVSEYVETKGMFASADRQEVYFDKEKGSFSGFLVQKGDKVEKGEELYEYEVKNYEAERKELESEITLLEEEIRAIEDYLRDVRFYSIEEPDTDIEDESYDYPAPSTYVETEFEKEEQTAEKEMELARKEAELAMFEDRLNQLEQGGETIAVTSTFEGTVSDVAETLNNPVLTIQSSELLIQGKLSESDRTEVSEGMPVLAKTPEGDRIAEGNVSLLHEFPEESGLEEESSYGFEAAINTNTEELLAGYHTNLDIITASSPETTAVFEKTLVTETPPFVWIMNEEGILEKRPVTTGLSEGEKTEITEGMQPDEWLAVKNKGTLTAGTPFVSPLDTEHLDMKRLFSVDPETIFTYGLLGLINR
ncbi:efflux RND transporter periplasmic adaptor subunit [Salimicrobium jeotgali]|uniref:efflux RND transporter periplasmic adaptor subunit n=1 Tax=Salimicrobium jeotgali TaxID=1230341 RepID=UPI000C81A935|nr:efflux RND transporter periplasmic adaptor subunit [Salimicrobium jeotgali]